MNPDLQIEVDTVDIANCSAASPTGKLRTIFRVNARDIEFPPSTMKRPVSRTVPGVVGKWFLKEYGGTVTGIRGWVGLRQIHKNPSTPEQIAENKETMELIAQCDRIAQGLEDAPVFGMDKTRPWTGTAHSAADNSPKAIPDESWNDAMLADWFKKNKITPTTGKDFKERVLAARRFALDVRERMPLRPPAGVLAIERANAAA